MPFFCKFLCFTSRTSPTLLPQHALLWYIRIYFYLIQLRQNFSFYRQKTDDKSVNIFHKHIYYVTTSLSTHCKTYCFAMRKRRFCTVKAAVLRCKRAAFAVPKRNQRFSCELYLQNQGYCQVLYQNFQKILVFLDFLNELVISSMLGA